MSRAAASNNLACQPLSFREIKSKLARETKSVQGEMEVKCLNSHSIRYYWPSSTDVGFVWLQYLKGMDVLHGTG